MLGGLRRTSLSASCTACRSINLASGVEGGERKDEEKNVPATVAAPLLGLWSSRFLGPRHSDMESWGRWTSLFSAGGEGVYRGDQRVGFLAILLA
jgi:hypothetical protein